MVTIGSDPRAGSATTEGCAPGDATRPRLPLDGATSLAAQLVLVCGRKDLASDEVRHLRQLGARLPAYEWHAVQHLAQLHGLAPLVFVHVAEAGVLPAIPAPVAAALSDAYRQTLVTNRHLRKALVQAVEALSAHAVPVIALKGVALATRTYGNLALRPSNDIDLLVRRADLRLAGQALRRLGYRPVRGQARVGDFSAQVFAELSYTRADNIHVELHWELAHAPVYRQALSVPDAWRRSDEYDLDGWCLRGLRVDDELRFLCTHCAADHDLDRLLWLVDIAELVRSLPPAWDWSHFVRETIAARLAAPVAVAFAACHDQLGLTLPSDVLPALRTAAATPAERSAWRAAHAPLFSHESLRAHLMARRGAADSARFLRGALLPGPTKLYQNYGGTAGVGAWLPLAYARHWERMARCLAAVCLETAVVSHGVRVAHARWPVRWRGHRPRCR